MEYMLSFDNLFVFHLVFNYYCTPEALLYRALNYGIAGAIVLRVIFLFFGYAFMSSGLYVVKLAFGVVLIWSGIKSAGDIEDEDASEPLNNCFIAWVTRNLPVSDSYEPHGRFFITVAEVDSFPDRTESGSWDREDVGLTETLRAESFEAPSSGLPRLESFEGSSLLDPQRSGAFSVSVGSSRSGGTPQHHVEARPRVGSGDFEVARQPAKLKRKASLLLLVVVAVWLVDLVFAVDSVASKLGSINDIFLNCSSSAFAMLALRSLYFVMESLIQTFQMLRYGIAAVLVLIGCKLIFGDFLSAVPTAVSFSAILAICAASMASSYWVPRLRENCESIDLGPIEEGDEDAYADADRAREAETLYRRPLQGSLLASDFSREEDPTLRLDCDRGLGLGSSRARERERGYASPSSPTSAAMSLRSAPSPKPRQELRPSHASSHALLPTSPKITSPTREPPSASLLPLSPDKKPVPSLRDPLAPLGESALELPASMLPEDLTAAMTGVNSSPSQVMPVTPVADAKASAPPAFTAPAAEVSAEALGEPAEAAVAPVMCVTQAPVGHTATSLEGSTVPTALAELSEAGDLRATTPDESAVKVAEAAREELASPETLAATEPAGSASTAPAEPLAPAQPLAAAPVEPAAIAAAGSVATDFAESATTSPTEEEVRPTADASETGTGPLEEFATTAAAGFAATEPAESAAVPVESAATAATEASELTTAAPEETAATAAPRPAREESVESAVAPAESAGSAEAAEPAATPDPASPELASTSPAEAEAERAAPVESLATAPAQLAELEPAEAEAKAEAETEAAADASLGAAVEAAAPDDASREDASVSAAPASPAAHDAGVSAAPAAVAASAAGDDDRPGVPATVR
eukprot:TRINITY_DN23356_c0_g1_i1.p1 TRINITY_DN23356_c0_g1~~TRINITY_DN23356_c0_g1_i1.p1  ORF type:complete len:1012 (+),score=235.95 TRINITY_DN23356_c0_g1_i1:417-3038(+)